MTKKEKEKKTDKDIVITTERKKLESTTDGLLIKFK